MNGFFVTGIHTNVGKTIFSAALCNILYNQGIKVLPVKPVESGCKTVEGELVTNDARLLHKYSQTSYSIDDVCAYKFAQELSPEKAAILSNSDMSLESLYNFVNQKNEFKVVEGAGGWYSPLAPNATNCSLASALKFPVWLVVDNYLGAVNHTLLTLEAIKSANIELAGIVLNQTSTNQINNISDFKRYIDEKIYIIDYQISTINYLKISKQLITQGILEDIL